MDSFYRGVVLVLISAASFSFLPIFALYAYKGGANVNTLLVIRFLTASLLLFSYLLLKIKVIRLKKEQVLPLFIMGSFYTVQAGAFFLGVKYISASLVSLLLYTYPMIVAILAAIFDKEKLTKGMLLAILAAFGGLTLVLGTGNGLIDYRGIFYSLGAAVIYSIYLTLGNRMIKAVPPIETSAFISLFAGICLTGFGLVTDGLTFDFSSLTWLWALLIALVPTVIAMLTLFLGMELIGSTKASILSMVEPLITIGLTMVLFGDKFSFLQGVGAAIVLSSALTVVWQQKKDCNQTVTGI